VSSLSWDIEIACKLVRREVPLHCVELHMQSVCGLIMFDVTAGKYIELAALASKTPGQLSSEKSGEASSATCRPRPFMR
jgi:hypothetical protein